MFPARSSFRPTEEQIQRIVAQLCDPDLAVSDIASEYGVSFGDFSMWILQPEIQSRMLAVEHAAAVRCRTIAVHCMPRVVKALDYAVRDYNQAAERVLINPHNLQQQADRARKREAARKAGLMLFRCATGGFLPVTISSDPAPTPAHITAPNLLPSTTTPTPTTPSEPAAQSPAPIDSATPAAPTTPSTSTLPPTPNPIPDFDPDEPRPIPRPRKRSEVPLDDRLPDQPPMDDAPRASTRRDVPTSRDRQGAGSPCHCTAAHKPSESPSTTPRRACSAESPASPHNTQHSTPPTPAPSSPEGRTTVAGGAAPTSAADRCQPPVSDSAPSPSSSDSPRPSEGGPPPTPDSKSPEISRLKSQDHPTSQSTSSTPPRTPPPSSPPSSTQAPASPAPRTDHPDP